MDLKKHFFMTFSALFFLGIIVAKPGSTFETEEKHECKILKGRLDCETRLSNNAYHKAIEYKYE